MVNLPVRQRMCQLTSDASWVLLLATLRPVCNITAVKNCKDPGLSQSLLWGLESAAGPPALLQGCSSAASGPRSASAGRPARCQSVPRPPAAAGAVVLAPELETQKISSQAAALQTACHHPPNHSHSKISTETSGAQGLGCRGGGSSSDLRAGRSDVGAGRPAASSAAPGRNRRPPAGSSTLRPAASGKRAGFTARRKCSTPSGLRCCICHRRTTPPAAQYACC